MSPTIPPAPTPITDRVRNRPFRTVRARFDRRRTHLSYQVTWMLDVAANTLTYSVAIDDLNPSLELGDTVLIWADTKFKKTTDSAPNTESGDGCAKPEVVSEVLSVVLR